MQTGEGDPAELLANLYFWTWNTQEVLDMIGWMRMHNAADPTPRIAFAGFDMQYSRRAMEIVQQYLDQVDHEAAALAAQHYACWRVWEGARTYRDLASSLECRAGVHAVHDLLVSGATAYQAASSAGAYARALQAARVVVQHEDISSGAGVRDAYMAENAAWLLEQAGPDGKVVLWAHNAHVQDREGAMGSWLRDQYGDDLVIIGFTFHRGWFNAYPMENGRVRGPVTSHATTAMEGAYESFFNQLDQPQFMIDLRELRAGGPADAAWLRGPLPFREIGAVYDASQPETYYTPSMLPTEFDVMVHFGETHPSVLLPFD